MISELEFEVDYLILSYDFSLNEYPVITTLIYNLTWLQNHVKYDTFLTLKTLFKNPFYIKESDNCQILY